MSKTKAAPSFEGPNRKQEVHEGANERVQMVMIENSEANAYRLIRLRNAD